MSERKEERVVWMPVVYAAFAVLAAIGVYSFVSVAMEGEARRACASTCILKPNYAGATRRAPDFTLKDMHGKDVSLSSFRGKVVVLNFWTKTCGPCLEEMPELSDLAKILKPNPDVVMLAVSVDEGPDDVRDTLKSVLREDPPFTILFDPTSEVVKGEFGTNLFPETWIIDAHGVIRARFDGGREWSNSIVVEMIDEIQSGATCSVEAQNGKLSKKSEELCDALNGG